MESVTKMKDELTQKIGVLTRRETEARVIAPFVDSLIKAFGKEKIIPILEDTVMTLARNQGSSMAKEYGNDVSAFLETLKFWTQDGALEIDLLEKNETKLDFNVTRCRYAEMYKALGIQDLGAVLSCNRDAAMIEGFNKDAYLDRKTTIMSGGKCCTFRYTFDNPNEPG
tara:strand:- start:1772 stop:2278 length:507 start_codon:yes stop_codon:yes gene_type:complete